jgi:cytochrome c oxidase subunit 2
VTRTHQWVALLGLFAAACGNPQSALSPAADAAARIADLAWILFWTTGILAALVIALLCLAIYRGRKAAAHAEQRPLPAPEHVLLLGAGAAFPGLVLILFAFMTVRVGSEVSAPPHEAALHIDVVAHQFWWEVHYPQLGITTANEIHLPAGRASRLNITSADVIHSFWVPRLHGKLDMNPGRTNVLWLHPREPGVYRGQCTELCGMQHALMAFLVVAQDSFAFQRWVTDQQRLAAPPLDPRLQRGVQVFFEAGCSQCHAIRGIHEPVFTGEPGPDLTHLATRQTLAAATIDFNRANLGGWILNPHDFKPGARMPATVLGSADFQALLAYLETLR